MHNKQTESHKKLSNYRTTLLFNIIVKENVFSAPSQKRDLRNTFVHSPPKLGANSISKIDKYRIFSYIRYYKLDPPTEIRQKR